VAEVGPAAVPAAPEPASTGPNGQLKLTTVPFLVYMIEDSSACGKFFNEVTLTVKAVLKGGAALESDTKDDAQLKTAAFLTGCVNAGDCVPMQQFVQLKANAEKAHLIYKKLTALCKVSTSGNGLSEAQELTSFLQFPKCKDGGVAALWGPRIKPWYHG